jgi:hypothetical protein
MLVDRLIAQEYRTHPSPYVPLEKKLGKKGY